MAELNNSESDENSESSGSSVNKVQVYTSLTQGNDAWLEQVADRKETSKSDVLRKLVHNARIKDNIEGEELII